MSLQKANKSKYIQSAKELKKHLDSEKYRAQRPERAFITWYTDARFGKSLGSNLNILDSKADGGIDALAEIEGITYLYQMKYETVPRVSNVTRDELAAFERLAQFFSNKTTPDEFGEFLESVRPQIRTRLKNIRKKASLNSGSVRFVFVTTKFNTYPTSLVEVEDVSRILSLWNLYSEGFTPPAEKIELSMTNVWNIESAEGAFITYVGLVDVQEFLKLMDDDRNERLFAQNVRTDLRTSINKNIKKTYEKDPEKFWLGNNGIYVVCKQMVASGKRYELIYPSIINGSQTLHSIYASSKRHACNILMRVLEIDMFDNPELLNEVIRRTNTQNSMKITNLLAHDRHQLNIAIFLDNFHIFYERRQREWINEKRDTLSNYIPIRIGDLTKWLATLYPSIGFGTARSRVRELYEEDKYEKIFGNYVENFKNKSYTELYLMVWSGLFVNKVISKISKNKKPFARMSQLLLIKGIFDILHNDEALKLQVKELLSKHRFGKKMIPRNLITEFSNIINGFIKLQKSVQKTNENLDFSNYFKRNELTQEAFDKIVRPATKGTLKIALKKSLDKIE